MNIQEKCKELIEKLSINKSMLYFESVETRDNTELMLMLIQQTNNGYLLENVSPRLKNDYQFVSQVVRQNGEALIYASKALKNDKTIALAAVQETGLALEFVSTELKNNKEVVLAAVNQRGTAIQYASDKFKSDKEVILAACIQAPVAIVYAAREIIIEIGKNNPVDFIQSQNLYTKLQEKIPMKEEIKKLKKKI